MSWAKSESSSFLVGVLQIPFSRIISSKTPLNKPRQKAFFSSTHGYFIRQSTTQCYSFPSPHNQNKTREILDENKLP